MKKDLLKNIFGHKKKRIIFICTAAVLAVAIAVIIILNTTVLAKAYKTIQLNKYLGKFTVTRSGNAIEVFESMYLQSDDIIATGQDGAARLKLDSSKYILLESDTEVVIKASGTNSGSKMALVLNHGKISNEISKKLNGSSTYEVETPNATMSVRGTKFLVSYSKEGNIQLIDVAVTDGKVMCTTHYDDSFGIEVTEDEIILETGYGLFIEVVKNADGTYTFTKQMYTLDKDFEIVTDNMSTEDPKKSPDFDKSIIDNLTPVPTATSTPVPTATSTPVPTATSTPVPTATSTPVPTATSTPVPTATSTPVPTATSTPVPTATSTPVPTATSTPVPTATSTPVPTATSTPVPTATSTPVPIATNTPTPEPTAEPTSSPTPEPTAEPTSSPTPEPTDEPTNSPTPEPTAEPTSSPTPEPTAEPTSSPTPEPTAEPTSSPTPEPTAEPTGSPTPEPTDEPTSTPTPEPTAEPTSAPTPEPTSAPAASPITASAKSESGTTTLTFKNIGSADVQFAYFRLKKANFTVTGCDQSKASVTESEDGEWYIFTIDSRYSNINTGTNLTVKVYWSNQSLEGANHNSFDLHVYYTSNGVIYDEIL